MGHHHIATTLLGSGWSLHTLLELYVATLYPLADMQSQGFKMNPQAKISLKAQTCTFFEQNYYKITYRAMRRECLQTVELDMERFES